MSIGAVSQIGLWVVGLVNLILILVLYRQFGLTAMASAAGHDNDGIPVGQVIHPLVLQRMEANRALEEVALDRSWSIVMFGTPHCGPCVVAMDQLDRAMPELSVASVRVIAALNGVEEDVRAFRDAKSYRFDVFVDPDGATSVVWGVKVTPFVMLIDPDRRVRSKAVASTEERFTAFLADAEATARDLTLTPVSDIS